MSEAEDNSLVPSKARQKMSLGSRQGAAGCVEIWIKKVHRYDSDHASTIEQQ